MGDLLTRTVEAVLGETRHPGAQLYVSVRGEPVVDVAVGCRDDGTPLEPDDLLVWFSAGKPFLAAAICRLADTGRLDLDAPVARYVPGFGVGGKDTVTCRHLLTHTGGRMHTADPDGVTAAFSVDYESAVRVAVEATLDPRDRPGEQPSYVSSTLSWLILSEVVRRVDGRRFDEYVTAEICGPLDIDARYGFTDRELDAFGGRVCTYRTPRRARYVNAADAEEGAAIQAVLSGGTFHRSLDPAAGLWASARAVGRFYEYVAGDARSGPLTTAAVREMVRPQRPSFFDETPLIDFGLGFTLETRRHGDEYAYFGSYCSDATFGHQGHGAPMAYADPEHALVVSFNGTGLPGRVVGKLLWRRLSDAVYRELGLADDRPATAALNVGARPTRDRAIDLRPRAAQQPEGKRR